MNIAKLVMCASPAESTNTIDNFSLNRIIFLKSHPIYLEGRKFAVYRWGIGLSKSGKKEHGRQEEKTNMESECPKCL